MIFKITKTGTISLLNTKLPVVTTLQQVLTILVL